MDVNLLNALNPDPAHHSAALGAGAERGGLCSSKLSLNVHFVLRRISTIAAIHHRPGKIGRSHVHN
jgi:hypothetical protein